VARRVARQCQLAVRNTPSAASIAVLDCDGHRGAVGKMLTKTVLVVAVCGIGATVPTLAQDEARIFQYSPIARFVGEGQYRAEVWRRENASGKEERAWSNSDLHGSSTEALAAACAKLRENFDDSFSCTQASRDAKAGETVKEPGTVVTEESRPPKENRSKAPPANSPVPAPKSAAAASPGSSDWGKEFWAHQSRWGHGGGGQSRQSAFVCQGDRGEAPTPPAGSVRSGCFASSRRNISHPALTLTYSRPASRNQLL